MHAAHRFSAAATLVAALAIALPASASADATGAQIVGWLNAQRAANGLPADIVEDPAQSQGCLEYDRYLAVNRGSPGINPVGATDAVQAAYRDGLAYRNAADFGGSEPPFGPWSATHDPFEETAAGLTLLLAPRLDRMGAGEQQGYGCATIASHGRPAPAADITYTYPGDGTSDYWTSQTVKSSTVSAAGQIETTVRDGGPRLYAFFDGPDFDADAPAASHTTAASLTGPDGPVAVDTIDAYDGTSSPAPAHRPSGVQLVPRDPLRPFATYTASVTAGVTPAAAGLPRTFTKTWSFSTGGLANSVAFDIVAPDPRTGELSVGFWSTAPDVTVTATGPGTTATASGTAIGPWIGGKAMLTLDRKGDWRICLRSGGEGTPYRSAQHCITMKAGADAVQPRPVPTPPAKAAPLVVVPSTASARLRGRTLTVSGVRCSAACRLTARATARAGRRSVVLGTAKASTPRAATITLRYVLSRVALRRLRALHAPHLTLTIVPKSAAGAAAKAVVGRVAIRR